MAGLALMAALTFLVCHLTGTGHLVRTLRLAETAAGRGHRVRVLSGGRPLAHVSVPDGVELIQLPPLTVPGLAFKDLRQPDGTAADQGYMARRAEAIASALHAQPPDALIMELFPFGRRVLRAEFLGAIESARRASPRTRIATSVRDIPEPKPRRLAETTQTIRDHVDVVLVHGDAKLVSLSTTWPLPDDLAGRIHHTGYVGVAMPPEPPVRSQTVLVSTGGGALGRQLVGVAVAAAGQDHRPWHILVGGPDGAEVAQAHADRIASPRITVEANRPDFRTHLAGAACSVSLCGYNTAVEIAGCTTPAVLVPSDEAGEQEQSIRARALAHHPGIAVLAFRDLTAKDLLAAVDRAADAPRRPLIGLGTDDGTGAITCLEALLDGDQARSGKPVTTPNC